MVENVFVGLNFTFCILQPRIIGQRPVTFIVSYNLEPRLVVCDEPVSALDVSVQAQVLNLLRDLQRTTGVALLFITHDMRVVRHMSDRIGVLYHGRLVEEGAAEDVIAHPSDPYTQELIDAIP